MKFRIPILLLLMAVLGCSQISVADRFQSAVFAWKGYAPTSTTAITTKTVYIDSIIFTVNADALCTMQDRSTDCNSGPCSIIADGSSFKAGFSYTQPVFKSEATNGFTLSCTVANAVVARFMGTY